MHPSSRKTGTFYSFSVSLKNNKQKCPNKVNKPSAQIKNYGDSDHLAKALL